MTPDPPTSQAACGTPGPGRAEPPVALLEVGADGRIRSANQAAARLLGLPRAAIEGRGFDEAAWGVTTPDGAPLDPATLPAARALRGEEVHGFEHGLLDPQDGTLRVVSVSAVPLRDGTGRVVGASAAVADVTARHAAEAALRASEARLRRVQRIGRVGGFEIDLATGRNSRSAEYMGLQGHPAIAREESHADWLRRLHPEDRDRAERRFLEAIADGGGNTDYAQDYRIVTPAGEVRWIAARAEVERDAAGRTLRMLGAHVDVTELKAAEIALAEAEQRGREVLESLGDMLYALDAEGRLRFASRRALDAWGAAPEAVMGRRMTEVFPSAEGSEAWAAIGAAMAGRMRLHLCVVSPLFGRWFELDIHPAAGGGVTVAARDVHDRRAAELRRRGTEAALRESETRLRLAQEAGGVGTWEWHVGTGALHWSDSCHRVHGMDPGWTPTMAGWMAAIEPADRAALEARLARLMEGEETRWEVEFRFRPPGGAAPRWIAGRGEIQRCPRTGRMQRMLGIAIDVTTRREAEERQSLLMRELDHRAKNALAVVQAAIRLVPKDDPDAFVRAVEGRIAALARAHTLLAEGRWEGVGLEELARAELAAFVGAAGEAPGRPAPRVALQGPAVLLAPTAAQAVSMALHELATNAIKHGALSAPTGRVALRWAREDAAGRLRLQWEETGGPPLAGTPARSGFGSRVLRATVAGQLGGHVALEWRKAGLRCELDIPLARGLARGAPPGR